MGDVRSGLSACSWSNWDVSKNPAYAIQFANPTLVIAAALAGAVGWRRRWLTPGEIVLTVGLLAVPYLTKGMVNGMGSFGRFVGVAFPIYLVAGRLFQKLPPAVAAVVLCGLFGTALAFAAQFAAGYPVL